MAVFVLLILNFVSRLFTNNNYPGTMKEGTANWGIKWLPGGSVKSDPTAGVTTMLIFGHFCIRGVNSWKLTLQKLRWTWMSTRTHQSVGTKVTLWGQKWPHWRGHLNDDFCSLLHPRPQLQGCCHFGSKFRDQLATIFCPNWMYLLS